MRRRLAVAALLAAGLLPGGAAPPTVRAQQSPAATSLQQDLDDLLRAPVLARALVGIRLESLGSRALLYQRNSDKLVVPASNLKLFTLAVAAERLGWDHVFETRLEAAGTIDAGTLTGDLVVVGGGDPTIVSPDLGHPALFLEWADALRQAGIRRVNGRLIGDDNAFDDEGLGAGWAWDYLAEGYAAPSGALSYNENVARVRIVAGLEAGDRVTISALPPGNGLLIENRVQTSQPGSTGSIAIARLPGSARLVVSGQLPPGAAPAPRLATIDNPTQYFVDALKLALEERGIQIGGGAWDIDAIGPPSAAPRRLIARRQSPPLSAIGGQMLKLSQNFYGEMLLKAAGRTPDRPGSAAAGRETVRDTLSAWGISADSFVMNDGSGLSRYDYVTADAVVTVLRHVWQTESLRGPFLAALPVGGADGTLETRLKSPALARRVQAKTGSISNMRGLSGYLETDSGDRVAFAIIVNHFTGPAAEVDEIAEKILLRIVRN